MPWVDPQADFVFDAVGVDVGPKGAVETKPTTDDDWLRIERDLLTLRAVAHFADGQPRVRHLRRLVVTLPLHLEHKIDIRLFGRGTPCARAHLLAEVIDPQNDGPCRAA